MPSDKKPSVVVKDEALDDGTETIKLDKPGQKYPTPTPGVAGPYLGLLPPPLTHPPTHPPPFLIKTKHTERIFYETLFEQNPQSAMAQEWCVQYGKKSPLPPTHPTHP